MAASGLVVVDAQVDFVTGSLAVPGAVKVVEGIATFIRRKGVIYKKLMATMDHHNPHTNNGGHFDEWPVHCAAFTDGADLANPLHLRMFHEVFQKGWDKPAFSGFEGVSMYNKTSTLDGYTNIYNIDTLDIVGIATDFCVKATVFDALRKGYKVNVLADLTAAVGDKQAALDEMEAAGATIRSSVLKRYPIRL